VAANWKTRYIWYSTEILLKIILYPLEEDYACWKRMLHPLEDFSIFYRGIAYWKTIIYIISKENCKWMNNASLQEGHRSLSYSILHFRAGFHYVKLMLHIVETYFPLKGRLYFFKDTLHLLERKTLHFARDGGQGLCNYVNAIGVQIYFNMFIPELCACRMIICLLTLMFIYLPSIRTADNRYHLHI
jgi:hypothetical protein